MEVTFEHGGRVSADVLIGADGINSTVRAWLFGPGTPQFAGSIAYRGLVPAERIRSLALPVEANAWLDPGHHLVHYFVAGGRFLNFVAVVPGRDWRVESWSAMGEVADAVAEFEGWHPQTRAIIGAADRTRRWGLYDRDLLAQWSVGRTTLLGDAAHAMLPFLAQGACQAIEDAIVLAHCVAKVTRETIPDALRDYQALRQPRVWEVQRLSRQNAITYHLPDGEAQRERDAQYAALAARGPYAARGWLFEYDPGDGASPTPSPPRKGGGV